MSSTRAADRPALILSGCGGSYNAGIDGQVQQLESGQRATAVRRTPTNKTLEVVKQINVITGGVTGAERASNGRMFDR